MRQQGTRRSGVTHVSESARAAVKTARIGPFSRMLPHMDCQSRVLDKVAAADGAWKKKTLGFPSGV